MDIDLIGEKEKSFDDFVKALPPNEPRYAVVDFDYTSKDGRDVEQLIFIFWCPDTTGVKNKMLYLYNSRYAANKETFKAKCPGLFRTYEA